MRRRLFAILSTLSLLLFVGVCVLWARSYWRLDRWFLHPRMYVSSWSGGVHLHGREDPHGYTGFLSRRRPPDMRWDDGYAASPRFCARVGGFLLERYPHIPLSNRSAQGPNRMWWTWQVRLPYGAAAAAAVTAVLPVTRLLITRRMRRRRSGLCPACGYDLRASRDRCPECGTPISRARSSAPMSVR